MSRIYAIIILGFIITGVRGYCLGFDPDSFTSSEIEMSSLDFRDLDGEIIVPPIGDGELVLDSALPTINPEESVQPDNFQEPQVSAQSVEQSLDTGSQPSLEDDSGNNMLEDFSEMNVNPEGSSLSQFQAAPPVENTTRGISLTQATIVPPAESGTHVQLSPIRTQSVTGLQDPQVTVQSVEQSLNPGNQPLLEDNSVEFVDNSQVIINKPNVNPEGSSLSQFQAAPPVENTTRGNSSSSAAVVETPAKSVSHTQLSPIRTQSVKEPLSTSQHQFPERPGGAFLKNHINSNSHSLGGVERTPVISSVTPVKTQTPSVTTSDTIKPVVVSTMPVSGARHRVLFDEVVSNNIKEVITGFTNSLQGLPPGETRELVVNSLVAEWGAAMEEKRMEGGISYEQSERMFSMVQDYSTTDLEEVYYTARMSNVLVDCGEIFINLKSAGSLRKGFPIFTPRLWNFYNSRDVVKELLKKIRRSESISGIKIKLVIPDDRSFMNRVFILVFAVLIFCVTLGYVLGRSYVVLRRYPISYQFREFM